MKTSTKKGLCVLLIMTVICVVMILIFRLPKADGKALVYLDGKVYGSYELNEDRIITVDSADGYNTIEIKDGWVSVVDANCPEGVCAHTAPISKELPGVIVCMPHKLVVQIE